MSWELKLFYDRCSCLKQCFRLYYVFTVRALVGHLKTSAVGSSHSNEGIKKNYSKYWANLVCILVIISCSFGSHLDTVT